MADTQTKALVIRKSDPADCKIATIPLAELDEGEVRVKIEKFGLTSNNVTYAALGGTMAYTEFFPLAEDPAYACLTVWGMATIEESRAEGISAGDRCYGFFPAAGRAVFRVADATGSGFRVDRPDIPSEYDFYHVYNMVGRDPFHVAGSEELMVVLRPLFLTGLLLADYLEVLEYFDAKHVLISASASKTSFGLAHALHTAGTARVVGLASDVSKAAAERMGVYDEVVTYEQVDGLRVEDSVYVDVCGKPELRPRLAEHLGGALKRIIAVGMTSWREAKFEGLTKTEGIETEFFFAPAWTERRRKEAGDAFLGKLVGDWQAEAQAAKAVFAVSESSGADALLAAYTGFVDGDARPDAAQVHAL